MKLKYQADIVQVDQCPPKSAKPCDRVAYRFIHSIADDDSFLPVAKISPGRINSSKTSEKKCSSLALSFYRSKKHAVDSHRYLSSAYKNFVKTAGDKIGEVQLKAKDGLATKPDHTGHFDLFEARGTSFGSRVSVVEDLAND